PHGLPRRGGAGRTGGGSLRRRHPRLPARVRADPQRRGRSPAAAGADPLAVTSITARTRPIVLLGDPVAHSFSPVFQNEAFRAAGVDGVYFALRCDEAAFPGLLRGIALGGGGGNVTVPHKERAAALLDMQTSAVSRTGACNTFWSEKGRICGDNTDVAGFDAAVRRLIGSPAGSRVLIGGAGGSAGAALCADR